MSYFTAYAPKIILISLAFLSLGAGPARAQQAGETPYAYPFTNPDLAQKLAANPLYIEMYSSLDCLFCPRAERLLDDLSRQGNAITLACHTDPEGPDYPIARAFCAQRQERVSAHLTDGLLYTPQFVIGGRVDAAGHEFDDVRQGLAIALAAPPMTRLAPRPSSEPGIYLVDLPATKMTGSTNLTLITFRPPYTVPKTMRQSTARPDPLLHVASHQTPMGAWDGRARTLSLPFIPSDTASGFVILAERDDGTVVAAGIGPSPP